MNAITRLALLSCLRTAFAGMSFNICGVSKAFALLERPGFMHQHPKYPLLDALHCVAWEHFDDAALLELVGVCSEVLGVDLLAEAPQTVRVVQPQLPVATTRLLA